MSSHQGAWSKTYLGIPDVGISAVLTKEVIVRARPTDTEFDVELEVPPAPGKAHNP